MNNAPRVSAIVPMFNRAATVGDAIRSLARQTLTDIEIVVVDDGSSDDSIAVVEALGEPRVRLVRLGSNRGIPEARNAGLDAARGRFIAWLDSDDTARPTRLAEQAALLDANPRIAMVGCCAGKLKADGSRKRGVRVPPLDPADIKAWLLFRSAYQQSSVFGRADILKLYPYAPENPVCEDLDMFLRLADEHPVANLPRVLIDRRMHAGQSIRQHQQAIATRKRALLGPALTRLGVAFDEADLARHVQLGNAKQAAVAADGAFLDWAEDWLDRLAAANAGSGWLDAEGLRLASAFFWVRACNAAKAPARFARSRHAAGLFGSHGRRWLARAAPLLVRG